MYVVIVKSILITEDVYSVDNKKIWKAKETSEKSDTRERHKKIS